MLAMLMLVIAQTVPGPPADDDAVPRPTVERRCVRGSDEIVVCAGDGDSQRLPPLPERGTRQVFGPAAVQLSPNKRAGLRFASSGNPNSSKPRMMMDFKIVF